MVDAVLRRQPGFPQFHVKTHPEKLTVLIWGSVSVLVSNKYLCTGRLAQSADVGVMNGQSGPELMNHCLCCTRSIQQEVEHQLNIRWRNQNSDCSLKSPLKGFSILLSAGVMPGSYTAPCWIQLKGESVAKVRQVTIFNVGLNKTCSFKQWWCAFRWWVWKMEMVNLE